MKKLILMNRYRELDPLLFSHPNAPIGDDLLLPFNRLAVAALARGVECATFHGEEDPAWWQDVAGCIFVDRPARGRFASPPTGGPYASPLPCPAYLIALENPMIAPDNWRDLDSFTTVFSWMPAPDLPLNRFRRIGYAQDFPRHLPPTEGRRFCCMIAANKQVDDLRSLYPLRRKALDAFGLHAGFDLYGPGWSPWVTERGCWRGFIPPGQKCATLAQYRFALVFENAAFSGYITEKLFDCLIAGTVPIYIGAPDVRDYVDADAFLDGRLFSGPVEMMRRLATMPDEEWNYHRDAGLAWMNSDASKPFRISTFVDTILDEVRA